MVEFPLVWLVSVLSALAAFALLQSRTLPFVSRAMLAAFLVALATLTALLGIRLAGLYDLPIKAQPCVAVLVAPLAFLGLASLTRDFGARWRKLAMLHGGALLVIELVLIAPLPLPFDFIVLMVNAYYLFRVVALLRLTQDDFPQIPPHAFRSVRAAIVGCAALLILMLSSDLLITLTVMSGGNEDILGLISGAAGFVTIYALIVALVAISMLVRGGSSASTDMASEADVPTDADRLLFEQLEQAMQEKQLFRDNAITLARLARRVGHPSRDISNAINRTSGENFSRFVNGFRIAHAKDLLRTTDLPVTEIMLEAGFVSKSSFNTEFRRLVGKTPSQFRSSSTKAS